MPARMIATLHAIELHAAALADRGATATDAAFLGRYRRHVIEQHGRLEPPDFERRRRVPIADLYVAPQIFQVADSESERVPREFSLWQLAAEIDRTVLLGDPSILARPARYVRKH
jgi:hypothetical protein